jgi:hypothetical protein
MTTVKDSKTIKPGTGTCEACARNAKDIDELKLQVEALTRVIETSCIPTPNPPANVSAAWQRHFKQAMKTAEREVRAELAGNPNAAA